MIIGHETVFQWLSHSFQQGRLGHGYLFVGPQHIGKATVARELAGRALCKNGNLRQEPCKKCSGCLGATNDLLEISAVSDTGADTSTKKLPEIGIALTRSARRFLALSSLAGSRRVVIVDNAERLTNEAANMLLKTLEEPPAGSLILMVCHEPAKLPQTVHSRLTLIPLNPLPAKRIEEALIQEGAEALTAQKLARLAGGRIGLALTWWRNGSIEPIRPALETLTAATFAKRHRRLTTVFDGGPEEIHAFMDTLLIALRNSLLKSVAAGKTDIALRISSQMNTVGALRVRLTESALNAKVAVDALAFTLA